MLRSASDLVNRSSCRPWALSPWMAYDRPDVSAILLANASVLEVERGMLVSDQAVLVHGTDIVEVGPTPTVRSAGPHN